MTNVTDTFTVWHLCRYDVCHWLNMQMIIWWFWFYVICVRFRILDPEINGIGWRSSGVGVRGGLWHRIPLRCIPILCQCSCGKWGVCVFTDSHMNMFNTLSIAWIDYCMFLQPEPLAEEELQRNPCANAVDSLETVLHAQSENRSVCVVYFYFLCMVLMIFSYFSLSLSGRYWRSARSMLDTVSLSYVKAERRYSAGTEAALVLGGLSMTVPRRSR